MSQSIKAIKKFLGDGAMSKRDLFSELTTALDDAKAHSQDKLTLRTHTVNDINDLAISPDEIVDV